MNNDDYYYYLSIIEIICVSIFTIEYFFRIMLSKDRLKYIFSFYGIIDFLAILPFYLQNPIDLINQMCRVGKQALVSFPNFANWRCRWSLLRGYIPETKTLPYSWYNTPNIRVISNRSFKKVCHQEGILIQKEIAFDANGNKRSLLFSNLLAEQVLFVLTKQS